MKLGVIALDGTKVAANASLAANREYQTLEAEVRQILAEAKAADEAEDGEYGPERRGDELPEGLGRRTDRLKRLLERLFDALETGKLGLDDLSPRIQQLRHRQDQLQAAQTDLEGLLQERRDELKDLSKITRYVADMRTWFRRAAWWNGRRLSSLS